MCGKGEVVSVRGLKRVRKNYAFYCFCACVVGRGSFCAWLVCSKVLWPCDVRIYASRSVWIYLPSCFGVEGCACTCCMLLCASFIDHFFFGKTLYHFHFYLFFLLENRIKMIDPKTNDIDNIGISETEPSERNLPILT